MDQSKELQQLNLLQQRLPNSLFDPKEEDIQLKERAKLTPNKAIPNQNSILWEHDMHRQSSPASSVKLRAQS